jgi:hypothetical protein
MAIRRTRKARNGKKYRNKRNVKKTLRKRARHNKAPKNTKPSNIPIIYGHLYSESCGHCIAMDEEWKNLCGEVKNIELKDVGDNYDQNVENLNREYQTDLNYEGFPTIFKLMKRGLPMQYYTGERSAELMKKWLYSS